jgi:long-subunit fatty acid transport protein
MAMCRKRSGLHRGARRNALAGAVALVLAVAAAPAQAVTNDENNATIPFSFSNPGARSLGMGGAFLGLADDATAAYTNPAGLVGLGLEQQFSIEVRDTSFDVPYITSGAISYPPLDFAAAEFGTASSSVTNVSFLSFVWPSERWSLAVYRHALLDFETSLTSPGVDVEVLNRNFTAGLFPRSGEADLEIVNYGVSFGWRANDAISIGAGLSWYDFSMETDVVRYRLGGTIGTAADVQNVQVQQGDDHDLGYNLGLLFHGSDDFQVGLAYRSAPDFEYDHINVAGAAAAEPGTVFVNSTAGFEAPDMFGIGFAWRASDSLTITADINKINYSNLTDPTESAFYSDEDLAAFPVLAEVLNRLRIDDVIEPHLGLEWVFLDMERPLSLRVGAWYEDEHTIQFEGDLAEFEQLVEGVPAEFRNDFLLDPIANAILFSTGEDQVHYSLGLGWAFRSFQIDFAADFADQRDTLSLSGVWRF